ncbi:Six-hairpin glycosidase-like protein [Mycena belliarum]|uniref:Six-hairpin glycosidase-like protein n=1 Tax=Mycena belliarum TaxID=1033014 RepID=A0AAD6TRU8_9AGAR|nr:Six-hairpin glycosidase-like protein [Mycena belliae]
MATVSTLLNITLTAAGFLSTPFDPGFNIPAVAARARALPTRSWEQGTAAQALLELESPLLSVFGPAPFSLGPLHPTLVPSLAYAATRITLGSTGLSDGDGAVGDPASLGVAAMMLGATDARFAAGVQGEIDYLLESAPRWPNGAISQRADVAEIWADFMYMAPPFLAYVGATTRNASLLEAAYTQCALQRAVLRTNSGLWQHIVGPESADPGLWSTGNGWAAMGLARVLATVLRAPAAHGTPWRARAVADLTAWAKEILDGARGAPRDHGLLRNYLDDTESAHGFGEIAGSAMLAAVAYRMAVLVPASFPAAPYVKWADSIRAVLGGDDADGAPHVRSDGTVTPAVNPLAWADTTPYTAGSPEGNNFVVLMYAAWRDCVWAGMCQAS